MKRRHIVLGGLLWATLAAVWFAPSPEKDIVAPQQRRSGTTAPAAVQAQASKVSSASDASIGALTFRLRDEGETPANPFAVMQWEMPVPKAVDKPVPVVEAPAPPQAPPLPFRVLGRYVEDGKDAVFLQYKDENLVVRKGDVLAGQYKVESLDSGQLTLVYLPLNERQTLNLGAAN
ncbi:MAG: hypothetical protein FWD62_15225 [Betaproteobacteria bacterium]|nr:hypothetical protein [Betaproteobacteria bacterium]